MRQHLSIFLTTFHGSITFADKAVSVWMNYKGLPEDCLTRYEKQPYFNY